MDPMTALRDSSLFEGFLEIRLEALVDRQQPPQPVHEAVLVGRLRCRRSGRCHRRAAEARDLLEHLPLVRRVSLHRLHEVGDEVVAALQLDVDLAVGVPVVVPLRDEPVVEAGPGERDGHRDADQHEEREHVGPPRGAGRVGGSSHASGRPAPTPRPPVRGAARAWNQWCVSRAGSFVDWRSL